MNLFSIPHTTIDWLLASQTPSIRYFAYTKLLNRPDDDPAVQTARVQITSTDYMQQIISAQDAEGFWNSKKHYYSPKYRSSHWSMLLLTELGAPPEMDALQKGAEFMIRRMEDDRNTYYPITSYQNSDQSGFCCYWGNWLRYQLHCGNINHPTIQQVIDIICEDVSRKSRCEYNYHLPCAWGVIRSLFGLALIPIHARSEKVKKAIKAGLSFILEEFSLVTANYPTPGKIHPIWGKLSFPLYYQSDILFTLRVLAELQALDHPRAQEALAWLRNRQKKDGTWRGGSPFNHQSHPFLSGTDRVDRWITLHGLSVFSAANKSASE